MDKQEQPPVVSGTVKASCGEDPRSDPPPTELPANLGLAIRRHLDRLLWQTFNRDKGEEK